jgi:hypothetical protein
MGGAFGKKPSDSHVIWTNRSGAGEGKKKFDFEYLELWAAHFGVDYETRVRVDHERSDRPREQHVVIFEWEQLETETMELGDREWTMGQQRTPRTFIEIDNSGEGRIKSWSTEIVVDFRELWLDGPAVKMKTTAHGKKAIDARKLLSKGKPESEA